jgi:hypothetical protein
MKRGAAACPHCGSDERTGWSADTYLDGIDLPDDVDYDDMVQKEFGGQTRGAQGRKRPWLTFVVGGILLLAFLLVLLRGVLG